MKAFILAATAQGSDLHCEIAAGQQVFAAGFHWNPTLSGAKWFSDRQDVVDIIGASAFNKTRDFLESGSVQPTDWCIIEMDYEITISSITDDERDGVIRKEAIARLSAEERRVLGI